MSVKGEKYASMKAKMKHEGKEGKMERMMEYGKPVAKKAVKKAVVKKAVAKKVAAKKK